MENCYLGIEIGGTKFQAVVADSRLNVLDRIMDTVGHEKDANILKKKIEKCIYSYRERYNIISIGVGFGGPVDVRTGTIFTSYQVSGWNNFNIVQWLTDKFGIPVVIDNDANTAALAEAVAGCGKDFNQVFYVTLGSGVGGGFINEGKIFHGKSTCEAEFGHIRINKKGDTIESCCSGWALNNNLESYIQKEPKSILAKLVEEKNTDPSKKILEAINSGDLHAKSIFDEFIDNLSFGLSHAIHILNPDLIIIGGGLSLMGEVVSNSISDKLPRYLMSALKNNIPKIKIASLKEDVVPIGAVLLAGAKPV